MSETKFYLWLKESGGCDHTIGCGQILIELKATDRRRAEIEARGEMEDIVDELRRIVVALILEVSNTIDVMPVFLEMRKAAEDEENAIRIGEMKNKIKLLEDEIARTEARR